MSDVTGKNGDNNLVQALIIVLIIMGLSVFITLSIFFVLYFIMT